MLNPWRGLRGLPSDVWIIFATSLVNRAGMMALPFLVLYLTTYQHVGASVAGLSISAYGIGGMITAPFAGRLCDRIGPFAVMRGSLAHGSRVAGDPARAQLSRSFSRSRSCGPSSPTQRDRRRCRRSRRRPLQSSARQPSPSIGWL
jgi:hypothetical protein